MKDENMKINKSASIFKLEIGKCKRKKKMEPKEAHRMKAIEKNSRAKQKQEDRESGHTHTDAFIQPNVKACTASY